jgi:hypothetical protein
VGGAAEFKASETTALRVHRQAASLRRDAAPRPHGHEADDIDDSLEIANVDSGRLRTHLSEEQIQHKVELRAELPNQTANKYPRLHPRMELA